MKQRFQGQEGIASVGILVALLILVTLGLGGLSVYSYSNYRDQRDNVAEKVSAAVAQAKTDQTAADATQFAEQEKLPNRSFSGPSDLGSVTFDYPKTWSVYIGSGTGGDSTYTAYFNPGTVPTVSDTQQFALRLKIENLSYESVLSGYAQQVSSGGLKSSIVTTNGLTGTRLDGKFSTSIEGSAAIFKVRDKTLTIRTDTPKYRNDFNNTIIPSLKFTP